MQTKNRFLSSYNSLTDPNLGFYFSNKRIQQHLKNSGLITEDGQIISEAAYNNNLVKIEKEEKMKDMMIQEFVERSFEREKKTQKIITAKLDEIIKLETVRNRKNEELKRKLKMNEVLMPSLLKLKMQSPHDVPRSSIYQRSHSANSRSSKKREDTNNLKKYVCQSLLVNVWRDPGTEIIQPKIKKPPCIVKLYYYGRRYRLNVDQTPPMDLIEIRQQINEAASIVVFRAGVVYNSTFCFASCRTSNSRFSLTFYIDGLVYCKISSCCEFKYKNGSKVGGTRGLFSFVEVQNGMRCHRCEEARNIKKSKNKQKKINVSQRNAKKNLASNSIKKEKDFRSFGDELSKLSIVNSCDDTHKYDEVNELVEQKEVSNYGERNKNQDDSEDDGNNADPKNIVDDSSSIKFNSQKSDSSRGLTVDMNGHTREDISIRSNSDKFHHGYKDKIVGQAASKRCDNSKHSDESDDDIFSESDDGEDDDYYTSTSNGDVESKVHTSIDKHA